MTELVGVSWVALLLLAVVVLLGALVQSVVGLGLGLLVAPVPAMVQPAWVPVLPLLLAMFVSALMLRGEWGHIDWRVVARSPPSRWSPLVWPLVPRGRQPRWAGRLSRALVLAPLVLVGFLIGLRVRGRLPQKRLRAAVLITCSGAALALLVRAFT